MITSIKKTVLCPEPRTNFKLVSCPGVVVSPKRLVGALTGESFCPEKVRKGMLSTPSLI